jgi:hypothetical protein
MTRLLRFGSFHAWLSPTSKLALGTKEKANVGRETAF